MSINWINTKYLASNNVKVYPSAYRGTDDSKIQIDPKAVLNLEENIIKSSQAGFPGAKSENSYIISWVDGLLKCVIAGYYFEITGVNKADIDDNHRYATVRLSHVTIADGTKTSILSPIDGPGNTSTNADPGAAMILDTKFGNDYAFIGLAFVNEVGTGFVGLDLLAAESTYKLSHTDILSNLKTKNNTVAPITGNIVDGDGYLSTVSLYDESGAQQNTATGIGAHARGYRTTATGAYSYAIGRYNVGKNDTLFEIGCGDSDSSRKNAFEVTSAGNININGSTTIDGNNLNIIESSGVTIEGDTTINGVTKINGNTTITGDTTINSGNVMATTTGSISLDGQYITLATPELLLGDKDHSKTINIEQSGITITGDTNINGNTTIEGNYINLTVPGIGSGAMDKTLIIESSGVTIDGDVAINSKLSVGTNFTVESTRTTIGKLVINSNDLSYGNWLNDTYFSISSVSGNPKGPEYGVRTTSQRIDKCVLGFDSHSDGDERVSNWAEFNSDGYCTYESRDSEASKKQTGKILSADLNNLCCLTELNSEEVAKRPTGSSAICPRLIVDKVTVRGGNSVEINLSNQGLNSILGVWLTEEKNNISSGYQNFAIEGYKVKIFNSASFDRTFSILVIAW